MNLPEIKIKKLYYFLFVIFLIFTVPVLSQNYIVQGTVSSQGQALKNVMVTDGDNSTVTNSRGRFKFEVSIDSRFIYITTPSGYLPKDSLNVPKFYKPLNGKENSVYNFDLQKNPNDDSNHVVLAHADPQFFKEENFMRYQEIVDDNIATIANYSNRDIFGVDLGDLSSDHPEFNSPYINALNKTGVPFYRALGNHDMNYGGRTNETSTKTYEGVFGPPNYSFNRGKAHYIVLNNVFYVGRDYFYMGYIDEKTYRWLENDLSHVAEGTLVFIAMHIPAKLNEETQAFKYDAETLAQQTVNIEHLFKMLKPYNVHILTGHMHANNNVIHSPTIYEHITAAISGAWWQGAYCVDGTPQGYGVYEVNGDKVKWYYKSVGHPREYQMRAYPIGTVEKYPDELVVNVWNWDRTWKVEWMEDGEVKGEMNQFTDFDPAAFTMLSDKSKLDFSWIAPVKTDHLFKIKPLSKNSKIEVVVTDHFGEMFKTVVPRE